jgi:hypothetical protein
VQPLLVVPIDDPSACADTQSLEAELIRLRGELESLEVAAAQQAHLAAQFEHPESAPLLDEVARSTAQRDALEELRDQRVAEIEDALQSAAKIA